MQNPGKIMPRRAAIDDAVERIRDGTIAGFVYDPKAAALLRDHRLSEAVFDDDVEPRGVENAPTNDCIVECHLRSYHTTPHHVAGGRYKPKSSRKRSI